MFQLGQVVVQRASPPESFFVAYEQEAINRTLPYINECLFPAVWCNWPPHVTVPAYIRPVYEVWASNDFLGQLIAVRDQEEVVLPTRKNPFSRPKEDILLDRA